MRGALLVAFMFVLSFPFCSAAPPIVPALTVTLSPASMLVNSTPYDKVTVNFSGTVQLDKLPVVRIVVSLTPKVDQGWACSCSPSSITVTDEQPHSFVCNAIIPENYPNVTAQLTVEATGRGGGFTITTTAQSTIIVQWIPPANWTGGAGGNKTGGAGGTGNTGMNQTIPGGNQSSQEGPYKLGPLDMTGLAVIVVVLAAAASGALLVRSRKRARLRFDDEEVEPVEEVKAL